MWCLITPYKDLTGTASCGCFGTVHVNPWLTLFAIDLPAVIVLGLFRPPSVLASLTPLLRSLTSAVTDRRNSIRRVVVEFARPMPSLRRFAVTAALGLAVLGIMTPNKIGTATNCLATGDVPQGSTKDLLGTYPIFERWMEGGPAMEWSACFLK